jgi:hypothetical protein
MKAVFLCSNYAGFLINFECAENQEKELPMSSNWWCRGQPEYKDIKLYGKYKILVDYENE